MSKKIFDVFTDTEKLAVNGDKLEALYDKSDRICGYVISNGGGQVAWLPSTVRIVERANLLGWDKHGHSIVPKNS